MYEKHVKRPLDFALSLCAIILFLPFLFVMMLLTAIAMGGTPFFIQPRVGKDEKVFALIKFRTMRFAYDKNGTLLPDNERLTRWGRALRATSLDELPELLNIVAGHLALVGPRPLPVKYLSRYSAEQRRRHEKRPGLTGLAQACGRNTLGWNEKFRLDIRYNQHITFREDMRILMKTLLCVIRRQGISGENHATMEEFLGENATDAEVDSMEGGNGYEAGNCYSGGQ